MRSEFSWRHILRYYIRLNMAANRSFCYIHRRTRIDFAGPSSTLASRVIRPLRTSMDLRLLDKPQMSGLPSPTTRLRIPTLDLPSSRPTKLKSCLSTTSGTSISIPSKTRKARFVDKFCARASSVRSKGPSLSNSISYSKGQYLSNSNSLSPEPLSHNLENPGELLNLLKICVVCICSG